jgi:hypothetical protein
MDVGGYRLNWPPPNFEHVHDIANLPKALALAKRGHLGDDCRGSQDHALIISVRASQPLLRDPNFR